MIRPLTPQISIRLLRYRSWRKPRIKQGQAIPSRDNDNPVTVIARSEACPEERGIKTTKQSLKKFIVKLIFAEL